MFFYLSYLGYLLIFFFDVKTFISWSLSRHVSYLAGKSAQILFALCILRSQGLSGASVSEVSRTYIIGRLTYASPAWWGFCTVGERNQLEAVVSRMVRKHFLPPNQRPHHEIINDADMRLILKVSSCPHHALDTFIPPMKGHTYDLRERRTNLQLPPAHTSSDKNFFNESFLSWTPHNLGCPLTFVNLIQLVSL